MNKKGMFFMLFLTLLVGWASADYNITCERTCNDIISQSYENCTTFPLYVNNTLYYNLTMDYLNYSSTTFLSNTVSVTYDDLFQDCKVNAVLDLQSPFPTVYVCSANDTYNVTLQVMNISNKTYDEWTCINQTVSNVECFGTQQPESRNDTFYWQAIEYSSTDGSCSGIELLHFPDDFPEFEDEVCTANWTVGTGSHDVKYRYRRFEIINDIDSCYNTSQNTGRPSDLEIQCDIGCGEAVYQFLVNWTVRDRWDLGCTDFYSDSYINYNTTLDVCDVTTEQVDCGEWSDPFNMTLLYGCGCAGDETGTGTLCEDELCNLTCLGVATNATLVEVMPTLGEVLQSDDPDDIIEYFKLSFNQVLEAFGQGLPFILGLLGGGLFLLLLLLGINALTGLGGS